MPFALSTHWHAWRHSCGEELVEEALQLGFTHLELGYDLRVDLVEGVRRQVEARAVAISSVHGPCPVPMGVASGHPEIALLASKNPSERARAIHLFATTAQFAAELGARCVVAHAGRVGLWWGPLTPKLIELARDGKQNTLRYERLKQKLLLKRDRAVAPHLAFLREGLHELLPELESCGVRLCLENLPSWEALPTEWEAEQLLRELGSPYVGSWFDTGHAQIRQNLGFVDWLRWLARLQPFIGGFHLHDALPPDGDHRMPPQGGINFAAMRPYVSPALPLVLEPMPGTPPEEVRDGLAYLRQVWQLDDAAAAGVAAPGDVAAAAEGGG